MLETLAMDVRAQIFGVVIVADFSALRLATFRCLAVQEYLLSLDLCQHCYPLRARGMYVVREPWFVRGLFAAMRPFMKPAVKDQLRAFGTDVALIRQFVPEEALPMLFGGSLRFDEEQNAGIWVEAVQKIVVSSS